MRVKLTGDIGSPIYKDAADGGGGGDINPKLAEASGKWEDTIQGRDIMSERILPPLASAEMKVSAAPGAPPVQTL